MKKTLLLFVILNSFQHLCLAQKQGQEKIDSLFSVLKVAKEDTAKVNTLNAIAFEYRSNKPDTAIYFANEALSLATKVNFKMGVADAYLWIGTAITNLGKYEKALSPLNDALRLYDQLLQITIGAEKTENKSKIFTQKAKCYNNIGNIYYYQGNFPEALKNYLASLKIREEIGDKKGIADSYNNIGNIYVSQGNYPDGLKNHLACLKIKEEIGDKNGISVSYNSIGNVYFYQGNYPEALKNYLASLKIQEEIGDKHGIATSYYSIANIYIYQDNYPDALKNYLASLIIREKIEDKKGIADSYLGIGNIYYLQGNYSDGLKNYLASLKFQEEIGDKQGIAMSFLGIGNIYYLQGNYSEALKNYLASLKTQEEIGDKQGIAASYNSIGYVYTLQNKTSDASQYLNKGLSLAIEIGSLVDIKESYRVLATLDSTQANFKQAFEHYKLYITYRDSLVNKENTKKLVQSQMQYDFDKKESLAKAEQEKKDAIALKEIQKQKLVRNGFVGGFAAMLLFAGVFFTQRNKIKKGKKLSDELLLNILPSEVAEELKQKGSTVAKQFDDVTVMFTDFKNFTQISENLSPSELVAEIDTCFKAFDNIMDKYRIEKIKTIGDSYMAAGGLPVPNITHADDVVKAAIEIQQFMEVHFKSSPLVSFGGVRIGIHTGPVVAGIVGVKKFAYDIWGDTVNIASRMESSCEAGKINISGSTYESVKDIFTCIHRGKIEAKNKGMIDMYFVDTKS